MRAGDKGEVRLDDLEYVARAFVILAFVTNKFHELDDTKIISKDAIPDIEDSMKILQKKDESGVFEKSFQSLLPVKVMCKLVQEGLAPHTIR